MSNENTSKISQQLGEIAEKLLDLANKGAKRLEDYAAKSAVENQNENARKLAAVMNKLSHKIEEKQKTYAINVEKNTEEMVDGVKKVYAELKNRAQVAKEKAEKDSNEDKTTNV